MTSGGKWIKEKSESHFRQHNRSHTCVLSSICRLEETCLSHLSYQQTPRTQHLSCCLLNLSSCDNCKMGDVISKSTEFVVNLLCSCFYDEAHHICRLDKNLDALKNAMGRLKARRNDVLNWVERDEDSGSQSLNGVKVWLTDVETIENQAREMHMACIDELQGLSLCEVCSKKLALRFRYGKEVFSMLEDVKELITTGDFNAVAAPAVRDVVEDMDLLTIVGQETILEKAWNHLMDGETKKMGIYGMGGVGKTTLLEQINNKFKGANGGFEKVIWVVVSKDKRIEKIQDDIGEKLGLRGEEWKQKEKRQKATDIRTRLKNTKFVLLLDDIWEEVDLKEVGVPFPTRENGCKVVFTTRSRQVCGQMGVDPIEVKCLEPDQAWDLFRDKVGKTTLESHPDILERARQVATKCRGLPLALIIIGKNMACKRTLEEWDEAIEDLSSYAAGFPGMKDRIFPILLYSYDSLTEDQPVKSCFQYCALFPEDSLIAKDSLADYWICEGFIDEKQGIRKAKNKAHGIIGTLVQACLLIEQGRHKSEVKMHDVVREMALWIATDFGKDKERCIVRAGVGLREVPTVENWASVTRMSLMENEIENLSDSPECPELTTLLFQRNIKTINMSGEFFKSMPSLVVLDISSHRYCNVLPEEISELVSLRYLNLASTGIHRLPGGLLKLKKLIYLDLEWTILESISGISNLSSLRTLRLAYSSASQDLDGMKELELLEHLEVVTIEITSILVANQLLNATATRVANAIQELYINDLNGEDSVLTIPNMAVLSTLDMYESEMVEIKIERKPSSLNKMPTTSGFPNLSRVTLHGCDCLKDVTWLLYAPNLIVLKVVYSSQIEDIISKEKADNIFTEDEAGTIIPFRRLERLEVSDLPKLKSIYWRPLPFPCLRKFYITRCPNLRKLPLDSKSGCSNPGEDLVIRNGEQHWIYKVEWEDESTKERFLLSSLQPPKWK